MVFSAEKSLKETKEQIKALQRDARQSTTLEKQQRRQRQEIFQVEDEIMTKRDELISKLEKRLAQKTEIEVLFMIQWSVV